MLVRVGHTEASVDLARLAGLKPAGVICEVMKEDGTMARLPDLEVFAEQHGLKIGIDRRPHQVQDAERDVREEGRRDEAPYPLRRRIQAHRLRQRRWTTRSIWPS